MIRVSVQLLPLGNKKFSKEIASITIVNDGSGSDVIGNYEYEVIADDVSHTGNLVGFKRRKYNVMYLIYLILKNVYRNIE